MEKSKFFLLGLLIFVSVGLIGCKKDEKKVVIKINASNSYGNMTTNVIQNYSLTEKYLPECEIKWSNMTSASDMRDALVSGQVDIVCTSLSTFIINYENGMPLKLISFSGGVPIGLYSNKEYSEMSSLPENVKILTKSKSNNGHVAFLVSTKEAFGDYIHLDNNLSIMNESDALGMLTSSDKYDCSNFSFPMNIKAEQAGLYKVKDYSEIIKQYNIGSCYFTTKDYYDKHPEVIEAFRNMQKEALQIMENDADDVAKHLEVDYNIDSKYIVQAMSEMPPTNIISGYDELAELLYKTGLIDHKPKLFSELENYSELNK